MDKQSFEMRTKCLSEVNYDLMLNLPRGEYFSGCIEITFTVLDSLPNHLSSIPIDFRGIKIANLEINGVE